MERESQIIRGVHIWHKTLRRSLTVSRARQRDSFTRFVTVAREQWGRHCLRLDTLQVDPGQTWTIGFRGVPFGPTAVQTALTLRCRSRNYAGVGSRN